MLKVECESCRAPYQVDEKRVPDTGLKMRCPKCQHTFLVKKDTAGDRARGAEPSQSLAHSSTDDFSDLPAALSAGLPVPASSRSNVGKPASRSTQAATPAARKLEPDPAPRSVFGAGFGDLDDLDLPSVGAASGLRSSSTRTFDHRSRLADVTPCADGAACDCSVRSCAFRAGQPTVRRPRSAEYCRTRTPGARARSCSAARAGRSQCCERRPTCTRSDDCGGWHSRTFGRPPRLWLAFGCAHRSSNGGLARIAFSRATRASVAGSGGSSRACAVAPESRTWPSFEWLETRFRRSRSRLRWWLRQRINARLWARAAR
jgi:predicted Zn finger-like uncharacterized protein